MKNTNFMTTGGNNKMTKNYNVFHYFIRRKILINLS